MPGDIGGRSNRNALSISGSGGGTTINPTNNVIPKRQNATTFIDSALTDNGANVTSTEPIFNTISGSTVIIGNSATNGFVSSASLGAYISGGTNFLMIGNGNGITLTGTSNFGFASAGNAFAGADTTIFRVAVGVMGFGAGGSTLIGWMQWSGQSRTTAQFDAVATTVLANVPGLSVTLAAGRKYKFRATLFVTADATGGHKYAIGGTATATNIIYNINALNDAASTFVVTSRQTALAGSAGQAGATEVFTEIIGTIVCANAGTLTVQFAQNVASGTSSVLINSTFEVFDTP